MVTRRQEKVARVIKETVSDCIANHLSDPRIEGLVSVTKVDVSPDLRNCDVYISVLGTDEAAQNKTFSAIQHATKRIQAFMAHNINMRFCPTLHIKNDDKFKKTLETMNLIDQAVSQNHLTDDDEDSDNPDNQIETDPDELNQDIEDTSDENEDDIEKIDE